VSRFLGHEGPFVFQRKVLGPGIHAVWSITADGKAELQAIRLDAAKFSVAEAKAWLKEHGHVFYTPSYNGSRFLVSQPSTHAACDWGRQSTLEPDEPQAHKKGRESLS